MTKDILTVKYVVVGNLANKNKSSTAKSVTQLCVLVRVRNVKILKTGMIYMNCV